MGLEIKSIKRTGKSREKITLTKGDNEYYRIVDGKSIKWNIKGTGKEPLNYVKPLEAAYKKFTTIKEIVTMQPKAAPKKAKAKKVAKK